MLLTVTVPKDGAAYYVIFSASGGVIGSMNVSGILVMTSPAMVDEVIEQLEALDGVDVHFTDAARGRIVITQEAETISAEVEGLKRIRSLPQVTMAEMSSHYFEDDKELVDAIPQDLDDESLTRGPVPAYLNE